MVLHSVSATDAETKNENRVRDVPLPTSPSIVPNHYLSLILFLLLHIITLLLPYYYIITILTAHTTSLSCISILQEPPPINCADDSIAVTVTQHSQLLLLLALLLLLLTTQTISICVLCKVFGSMAYACAFVSLSAALAHTPAGFSASGSSVSF